MLELLVSKKYAECSSQHVKWTSEARVVIFLILHYFSVFGIPVFLIFPYLCSLFFQVFPYFSVFVFSVFPYFLFSLFVFPVFPYFSVCFLIFPYFSLFVFPVFRNFPYFSLPVRKKWLHFGSVICNLTWREGRCVIVLSMLRAKRSRASQEHFAQSLQNTVLGAKYSASSNFAKESCAKYSTYSLAVARNNILQICQRTLRASNSIIPSVWWKSSS